MYRVIDVADMLGVSKVTIYKKIKLLKPGILSEMLEEDNVTYLTDKAVLMIKNSIKRKTSNQFNSDNVMQLIEMKIELDKVNHEMKAFEAKLEKVKLEQYEELLLSKRVLEETLAVKKINYESIIQAIESLDEAINQIEGQISLFAKLLKSIV